MHPPRLTLRYLRRLYDRANALLAAGCTDAAARHFRRIAASHVRLPGRNAGDPALETCENPLVVDARLGLCYCFVEQGRLDNALAEVTGVLEMEPTNAEAMCELAYIQCLMGQRAQARRVLEGAILQHPECARARKALGYFFLQEDDVESAIRELEAAVQCDADYDLAHVELAVALARAGRLDEAVLSMSRALSLAPLRPDYYYSLGALLRQNHRSEEARGILLLGHDLAPESVDLLEALAETMLEVGDIDGAIEFGQRLLRRVPASMTARDVLGVAYLQCGRIHDALRMADQMAALNPFDPSHHFKKAVLFQHQGMLRHALREYERVTDLDPDSDLAFEALQAMEQIDHQQIRQILVLIGEDSVFRARMRRDPLETVRDRGFILSERGEMTLTAMNLDMIPHSIQNAGIVAYH